MRSFNGLSGGENPIHWPGITASQGLAVKLAYPGVILGRTTLLLRALAAAEAEEHTIVPRVNSIIIILVYSTLRILVGEDTWVLCIQTQSRIRLYL